MIISVPVVIATLAAMRVLEFGADDVGFAVRRLPLQIAVALTGVPLGLAGYLILEPQTLVIGLTSLLFAILSTGQLSVLNMVFMFRVALVPLHSTRYTLIRTPATLNLEP
ncbi:hypothetical protein M1O52_02345 [Dehalococcoidia bacterium]|nr:hypothetical protein [Dehalococcoidia bacterium]